MRRFRTTILLAAALLIAGCRAKGKWSETDALREELAEAKHTITTLTAERNEAQAKLAEADRVRLTSSELTAEQAAALPRVALLNIDRLSGLTDSDPAAPPAFDAIEVYLKPVDARERFVQVVGQVNVRADLIPPADSASPPITISSAVYNPTQLREAYRSTFLSTHYTLHMTITNTAAFEPLLDGSSIALSVEFLDALTGRIHRAERILPVARPILTR